METATSKYDKIGMGYNKTRTADPYLLGRMHDLLGLNESQILLDIGCGSGNYTIALAQKGLLCIGVDPSEHMLDLAQKRDQSIKWIKGHAERIPLIDNSVDAVLASLTLHHWSDLLLGFKEIRRVMHQTGRIVIFSSTSEQMSSYWLNHYFPQMLQQSIKQMPSIHAIREALQANNFVITLEEKYEVKPDLQDKFLYVGKSQPHLYLDPQIRNGISSFSDLALKSEVSEGLARLQNDIESGEIDKIIRQHDNSAGDYIFVVAQKK
jgi:ubiquinone/menaquinone biosynthesis C-methylase UbiE